MIDGPRRRHHPGLRIDVDVDDLAAWARRHTPWLDPSRETAMVCALMRCADDADRQMRIRGCRVRVTGGRDDLDR